MIPGEAATSLLLVLLQEHVSTRSTGAVWVLTLHCDDHKQGSRIPAATSRAMFSLILTSYHRSSNTEAGMTQQNQLKEQWEHCVSRYLVGVTAWLDYLDGLMWSDKAGTEKAEEETRCQRPCQGGTMSLTQRRRGGCRGWPREGNKPQRSSVKKQSADLSAVIPATEDMNDF